LCYLHESRKVHRDVKPENILITTAGLVKLADFGVSAQIPTVDHKKISIVGTPYFMAPEVVSANGGYNEKADIWSLGISAIDMAQTEPPRFEIPPSKVIWMIPHFPPPTLKFPQNFTSTFNHFIAFCLVKDPSVRPSAEQLLQHPFLTDHQSTIHFELSDALQDCHVIVKEAGGIELALKKARARKRLEKQESAISPPSIISINNTGQDDAAPDHRKKEQKKDRKKKIIKGKLAHFFTRRPKVEDILKKGILGHIDESPSLTNTKIRIVISDHANNTNVLPNASATAINDNTTDFFPNINAAVDNANTSNNNPSIINDTNADDEVTNINSNTNCDRKPIEKLSLRLLPPPSLFTPPLSPHSLSLLRSQSLSISPPSQKSPPGDNNTWTRHKPTKRRSMKLVFEQDKDDDDTRENNVQMGKERKLAKSSTLSSIMFARKDK